jgi:hypothetical protein
MPPTNVAGNVLRPETSLKISMRTPPTLDSIKKVNFLRISNSDKKKTISFYSLKFNLTSNLF